MQKQIFPPSIIENTTQTYLSRISTRNQLIYSILVISIVIFSLATPFIALDISIQSTGIIRTSTERNEIKSIVAGKITQVHIRENQKITQGQNLFTLQVEDLETRARLNWKTRVEKSQFVSDLTRLVKLDTFNLFYLSGLITPLYQQQFSELKFQLNENLRQQKRVKKELNIDKSLYQDKVIARREYEDRADAYQKLKNEFILILETQLSRWQADLASHHQEIAELQTQAKQIKQEKDLYVIKAPIAGTIQELSGKYADSPIQTGEVLGIISPDSTLLAECYVSPKDIGYLKKGMECNFQIDAFNYNEWGLLSGKITDIANDFVLLDKLPIFKVRCQIKQNYLVLKNGYRGYLKKGMTIRARFVVARRTLWQIIWDKADKWLNPTQNEMAKK
jgi:HlyD family secretion protein